jgi:hypothetical protein
MSTFNPNNFQMVPMQMPMQMPMIQMAGQGGLGMNHNFIGAGQGGLFSQMKMMNPNIKFNWSGGNNFIPQQITNGCIENDNLIECGNQKINNMVSYQSIMEACKNNSSQVGECVNINGVPYVIRKTGEYGWAERVN